MKYSAGLVIVYQDKILLGHPTGSRWWGSYSIPKGGIDKNESKLDAAIRETYEEVGINISKSKIDSTKYFYDMKSKRVYYYIVRINSLQEIGLTSEIITRSNLQLDEFDWAGFISLSEAKKRITKSQLSILDTISKLDISESNLLTYSEFIVRQADLK